jgi:RHS repeat-associated protein
VNGSTAALYGDLTFASTNFGLTNGNNAFSIIASNVYGTKTTNAFTLNLPSTINLQYDTNGNLTGDGLRTFVYDAENQLTNVFVANQWKTEFVYDGFGRRRVSKDFTWQGTNWLKTNETRYVCDGLLPIQDRDSNNAVQITYTRGLDLGGSLQGAGGIGGLLAMTLPSTINSPPSTYYYHADGSGNITSLIDAQQNIVARYLYDPFGRLISKSGALADVNRYQFSSKEVHPASGLYYYGFRFYDTSLQRWLNQDPIGEAGGINLYGFGRNQSVNALDLFGFQPEEYTHLPTDGFWSGKPGDSIFYPGELYDKYKKGIPFKGGQPDLGTFSEGQIVAFENEFNVKTDSGKAIAEMKKRNPKWKPKEGWEWHHFEAEGRRELQYVPGELNDLTHKCPPVAKQRQAIMKTAKNRSKPSAGAVLALAGTVLAASALAANHQEDFNQLQLSLPLYLRAREACEPTSGYSEEIATSFSSIFANDLYFYAIMYELEGDKAKK